MKNQLIEKNDKLKGLRVMVTRPSPVGEMLCKEIIGAGGKAVHFPTIIISEPDNIALFKQQILRLDQQDWLVFISPLTVYIAANYIHEAWSNFPAHLKVAAIGLGTANVLKEMNLPVHIYPNEKWNSEALLELPSFQNIKDTKIAIFCGEDGSHWLTETFAARGARVSRVVAYRRSFPINISKYNELLRTEQFDAIVSTSGDGLRNLRQLLEPAWEYLREIPIVVISERMQTLGQELGFNKIILAKNASHSAIIETLSHLNKV